jgi:O-methyltransferase
VSVSISRSEVIQVYREILGRNPESEDVIAQQMNLHHTVVSLATAAATSPEFRGRFARERVAGFEIARHADRVYEVIEPSATYAPWRSDSEFLSVWHRICSHSLVDHYRAWNLWQLVRQVAKGTAREGHFVEIGVWRGGTGMLTARRMLACGLTQPIHLCDTFEGVPKASEEDPYYRGGEHGDTSTGLLPPLAHALGLPDSAYRICVGIFPEDMPDTLRDGQFGFVHIDVDAYESGRGCFAEVWPRMAPGGVVVFDDYGFEGTVGIAKLVDELAAIPDGLFMHNLNGHAVFVKLG